MFVYIILVLDICCYFIKTSRYDDTALFKLVVSRKVAHNPHPYYIRGIHMYQYIEIDLSQ